VREQIAGATVHAAGHEVHITASVGLASEPGDDLPGLEELLRRADEALYAAKAAGRNRVITIDAPLEAASA
jgi:diguanylate cyclase (GGDEF)-like protein